MLKPWLKRILQVAGTLALIALVVGVYRRTDWSNGFTPDGALTLVAGVIAFIAVIIQIRSSSKQVQDQIKEQRDAEREERERQKRAVAAALLAEIDDFYKFSLRGLWEEREHICGAMASLTKPPPELGPLPSTALLVYRANAHQLGTLSALTVISLVGLYNFMAGFVDHYEAYRRAWSPSSPPADPELATKLRDIFDIVPKLILNSYRACRQLDEEHELRFEESWFSLARIREADDKGQTMIQLLKGEAARVRERISKSYGT
jgi:hypothetical protein